MMQRLLLAILISSLIISLPSYTWAEPPPRPVRKTDIETITTHLTEEKKTRDALENKLSGIRKELDHTRSALISLAKDIKENEQKLDALDKKSLELKNSEALLKEKLEKDYALMGDIILALARIKRIPPVLLIARPESPHRTAQSAMLLKQTLPAIQNQSAALSRDLEELSNIEKELEKDRTESIVVKTNLEKKQKSLNELTEKRKTLYALTQKDYEENKARIARLSEEAETLKELLENLENDQIKRKPHNIPSVYTEKIPDSGKSRIPVTGVIIESFGTTNALGAKSQGITLESLPGALVVAPMGGIVRFCGPFKNYGNMIIIEHEGKYHSLIAGFQDIKTGLDDHVKPGEPIGELPQTSSRGGKPALYYELRYKGDPVNPATVFPEIKS